MLANRRIAVEVASIIDAMLDPRIGRGVADALVLAHGTATGEAVGERQCFVCCRPWAMERPPVGVATMQVLGTDRALLCLICVECFAGGADARFRAAVRRDFGSGVEIRTIHDAAGVSQ